MAASRGCSLGAKGAGRFSASWHLRTLMAFQKQVKGIIEAINSQIQKAANIFYDHGLFAALYASISFSPREDNMAEVTSLLMARKER